MAGNEREGGMSIAGFKDYRCRLIQEGRNPGKGFASDLLRITSRKLAMLDAAVNLDDLRSPPGNRLEALKGDRRGQFSIRVDRQWRLCFRWDDNRAYDVELVDYHD